MGHGWSTSYRPVRRSCRGKSLGAPLPRGVRPSLAGRRLRISCVPPLSVGGVLGLSGRRPDVASRQLRWVRPGRRRLSAARGATKMRVLDCTSFESALRSCATVLDRVTGDLLASLRAHEYAALPEDERMEYPAEELLPRHVLGVRSEQLPS